MSNNLEKSYIVRWASSAHEGKYEYMILMRAKHEEVWMAIDQIASPLLGEIRVIPPSKARGLFFHQNEYNEENENEFELECLGGGTPDTLWNESKPAELPEKPEWYVPYTA